MLTTFILFLTIIILLGLGIALWTDENDLGLLYIWGIIIVIIVSTLAIIDVNSTTNIEKSKQLIIPEIKIETKIIDNKVISSDTTYIYTFKNE